MAGAGLRPRLEALGLKQGHWTWPPAGARWQGFSPCLGEQGCADEGTQDTRRRDEDMWGARCSRCQHWESLNAAQTSYPACPLRGHSRHPEDFGSLGILVIGSGVLRASALTRRRSLCSLHGTPCVPGRPAEPESLHAYRALPEGPLAHSLISQPPAWSFLMS